MRVKGMRQPKVWSRAAIALFVFLCLILYPALCSVGTALAQENTPLPPVPVPLPTPDPPPPLTAQQEAALEKFVKDEIQNSREVGDRVQDEVGRTFGWTLDLVNLLISVLIAIPILTGLAALYLRRSIIDQVVRDIQKEVELVREQLKVQAAQDLKTQLETFRQELELAQTNFVSQLQTLSTSAQQEKDRIFQELARITPSIIQQEFVAPEIQARIRELTHQLQALRSNYSQIVLSVDDYLKEADAFYFERQYEAAIASFNKAIEIDPNCVSAWLGQAKALRRAKQHHESLAANERVIQLQPDNPSGWFGKGFALIDLQKYAEAVAATDRAIQLEPDRGVFWRNKGYALMKLGADQEALACFDRALELKPNSGRTYYWKAAYHALKQQIEPALPNLSKALRFNGDYLRGELETDPDFDWIREDDRFKELLKS